MKFKKIAAFILAAALLSGCAVREDYSEYISEPVQSVQSDSVSESSADISDISIDTSISEESSDDEEINTSVYAEKYSNFGAIVNFENEDKIEYNGGNVTVPISVGGTNGNTTDLELGILLCINGFCQEISVNGSEPTDMYIKTYEPDRGDLLEITFEPRIPEKDKDKTILICNIVAYFFPTVTDEKNSVALDHSRSVFFHGAAPMYLNTPITDFIDAEPEEFETIPKTMSTIKENINLYGDPNVETGNPDRIFGIQPSKSEEYINKFVLNDDGSGDITVYGGLEDEQLYRITLYKKGGKLLTFNGGKSYLEMEMKKDELYMADLNIPDLKPGDYVSAFFTPIVDATLDDRGIADFSYGKLDQGAASWIMFAEENKI